MSSAYYVQLHCAFNDEFMLNIEVFSIQLDNKQVEHNSNCTNLFVSPYKQENHFSSHSNGTLPPVFQMKNSTIG